MAVKKLPCSRRRRGRRPRGRRRRGRRRRGRRPPGRHAFCLAALFYQAFLPTGKGCCCDERFGDQILKNCENLLCPNHLPHTFIASMEYLY